MRNAYLLLERRKEVGRIDSDSKLSVTTLKSQENGPGGHGVLFRRLGKKTRDRRRGEASGRKRVCDRKRWSCSRGASNKLPDNVTAAGRYRHWLTVRPRMAALRRAVILVSRLPLHHRPNIYPASSQEGKTGDKEGPWRDDIFVL